MHFTQHILMVCISTGSYENRVSKHFAISLNFPCLMIASLLSCLLRSFGEFLSSIYQPPPPPTPLHSLTPIFLLGGPWGQRPIIKWRQTRLCTKKTKWRTELPEDFACPIPFQWGRGDGSFQVIWRSDLERTQNYCVKLLSLYLRRIII